MINDDRKAFLSQFYTVFSFKERERSIHKKDALNFASNESLHICTLGKEKHCCFLQDLFWQFIFEYTSPYYRDGPKFYLFFVYFHMKKRRSPFWKRRESANRSWAHRSRSLRGTCTPPSCSSPASATQQEHVSTPAGSDVIRIGCHVTKYTEDWCHIKEYFPKN